VSRLFTGHVRVPWHFAVEPDVLFDRLAEHETMNEIYPSTTTRLSDGEDARNGVGSSRSMKQLRGFLTLVETVTRYEPPAFIEYRLESGAGFLVKEHIGEMHITPSPTGGSDLLYEIRVTSPIPGVGAAACVVLGVLIRRGLPKLQVYAARRRTRQRQASDTAAPAATTKTGAADAHTKEMWPLIAQSMGAIQTARPSTPATAASTVAETSQARQPQRASAAATVTPTKKRKTKTHQKCRRVPSCSATGYQADVSLPAN
jgi:hypothetical protein